MLRTPLWPPERLDSQVLGDVQIKDVPVLERHELAASKLVALLARHASRDLFDAVQLLRREGWDWDRLRLALAPPRDEAVLLLWAAVNIRGPFGTPGR